MMLVCSKIGEKNEGNHSTSGPHEEKTAQASKVQMPRVQNMSSITIKKENRMEF